MSVLEEPSRVEYVVAAVWEFNDGGKPETQVLSTGTEDACIDALARTQSDTTVYGGDRKPVHWFAVVCRAGDLDGYET